MQTIKERMRRAVALASVALASGWIQTAALARPFNPAYTDQQAVGYTRPRRVDASDKDASDKEDDERYGEQGPMVRIGLAVDAASASLTSSAGLIVRRSTDEQTEGKRLASTRLRAEVRQQKSAVVAAKPVYRAEVATYPDSRQARKATDDLKKKFYEAPSTVYDSNADRYQVFIGRFTNRREAAEMVDRLAQAGYSAARIAIEPAAPDSKSITSQAASAQGRSIQGRTGAVARPATSQSGEKTVPTVAAFDADKMIATSDTVLIVSTATATANRDLLDYKPATYKSSDERATAKEAEKPASIRVGNNDYRGEIHLVLNERGRINIVNVLPLEVYLRGVVPLELSPGAFPQIEALKAQAIAARTYAVSHLGRNSKEGFDLHDDPRSQVYGGLSAEHPVTNRAIEQTRGLIAFYKGEDGRKEPIEALYTSTCGGHTESNEAIFLTKPLAYLRGVECAPERSAATVSRELVSGVAMEPLVTSEGREVARDVALIEVLGFNLPRRVTNQYLKGSIDQDEARSWMEHAARLLRRDKPQPQRGQVARLPGFASYLAAALYGEGRASLLLSSADIAYILDGIEGDDLPKQMRADIALLLKEGVLRVPPGGLSGAGAVVTRAYALETLARVFSMKFDLASAKLEKAVAQAAEDNRLIVSDSKLRNSHMTRISSPKPASDSKAAANSPGARNTKESSEGFEIARGAWLFRKYGSESYAVDRLTLVGGERITYHLNADGRVDFLEAEASERGASSDRYSSTSRWQERLSVAEVEQRLARARTNVGQIRDLVPLTYGSSNRVLELEIIGAKSTARLRGFQVRTGLGLKESLFVIERERDDEGRVTAFVFTGRGWGHGVGMCQTGAYGLAREGYSYADILKKYYTGIKLDRAY